MGTGWDRPDAGDVLRSLAEQVSELRDEVERAPSQAADVHPLHGSSARNLEHFLALRSRDRRALQDELSSFGISSIGRADGWVLGSIDAVLRTLHACAGLAPPPACGPALGDDEGAELLRRHAVRLLGPAPAGRDTRIMVTLPGEAATDPDLVAALVRAGMDLARINCAHDDAAAWSRMAANVRSAAADAGRPVRVVMDLAGPKVRTGPFAPGPAVVRARPRRDDLGEVVAPASLLLVDARLTDGERRSRLGAPDVPVVPVTGPLVGRVGVGDVVDLRDRRSRRRRLVVQRVGPGWARVDADRTTYLTPGTALSSGDAAGVVAELPQLPGGAVVAEGDEIVLVADDGPAGRLHDENDPRLRVGCTSVEALDALSVGHRVLFDDGRFEGVVRGHAADGVAVRILRVGGGRARLRGDRGINLPDTRLPLPALSARDRADLALAAELADVVALSFVRSAADVEDLQAHLDSLGAQGLGVLLKIETTAGFVDLPAILRQGLRSPAVGVVIARGDLAVELGYERLAEVQEEVLWACEAAHVPVVWATEVLDRLAHSGRPSRSEITDAAMAERAECVMLNKGPYVTEAIEVLDGITRRMSTLQRKKRALLRRLGSWCADPVPAPARVDLRTPPRTGSGDRPGAGVVASG